MGQIGRAISAGEGVGGAQRHVIALVDQVDLLVLQAQVHQHAGVAPPVVGQRVEAGAGAPPDLSPSRCGSGGGFWLTAASAASMISSASQHWA